MRSGLVEANLVTLNETARLPYIAELIQRKVEGKEKECINDADLAFHSQEYERLRIVLQTEYDASKLPETPDAGDALHELLVRIRTRPNPLSSHS